MHLFLYFPVRFFRFIPLCFILLLLTACKTELYSGLQQKEANEMYSLLLEHHIIADRKTAKEGKVILLVEESQVPYAIDLLKQRGYPWEQFQSLNDIFPGDTLIPGPQELAAKLNYVRSQELARILSDIDGVITAQVLFTRQESQMNTEMTDGYGVRAAVFIKYAADIPVFRYREQIIHLVKNSIEGLDQKNISLTLIPAITTKPAIVTPELRTILNIQVTTGSYHKLLSYFTGCIVLLVISHLLHYFLNRRNKRHGSAD
ncbi:type III secretion system inner membrane ring lipoprotein SctJ [Morganella morganii]|nr:EscJ/YscJ/HrcJ family type III secretion inner membrane ring protein [Morganella morganii]